MYYTGIDLHKKTSFITTINETGKIVSKGNFKNVESDVCLQKVLDKLGLKIGEVFRFQIPFSGRLSNL